MKIDKLSFVDRAAAQLRNEIVHGRLLPAERLTEIVLSERLGTGRGTVRAALSILESEDLIVRQPYSGWSVRDVSEKELWETYTLRGALEGLAARLVAAAVDETIEAGITAAFERLQSAQSGKDGAERVDADLNFHRTIVNLAGHASLTRQYFGLSNKVEWLYRWSETHWPSRIDLTSWHRPIVEAILARDPFAAERAVQVHGEASLADDLRDFSELRRQSA
ncbi:GntR family transcriptional regulator [Shinella daejeonensis]|uniref:GntR family transcriptional regulator n=1 Tax=Shinella daejeonensis TaxID=659017 RepID=UPI0020C785C1|nr:GntR family transcriptional regulator [Shinella daejeonensis]MCP8894929.1 GntR family transcriptional regulator [Shinella daejeonensis]